MDYFTQNWIDWIRYDLDYDFLHVASRRRRIRVAPTNDNNNIDRVEMNGNSPFLN